MIANKLSNNNPQARATLSHYHVSHDSQELPMPDRLTPQAYYVLLALGEETRHGYAMIQRFAELTGGSEELLPGTLYATLARMVATGLIEEARAPAGRGGGGPAAPALPRHRSWTRRCRSRDRADAPAAERGSAGLAAGARPMSEALAVRLFRLAARGFSRSHRLRWLDDMTATFRDALQAHPRPLRFTLRACADAF